MIQLLLNIKIIDFTRLLPGPMATKLLAQMGAAVIKIESPKRIDYTRGLGKQVDGKSILFHMLNHHKDLKMIDYETDEGKEQIYEMIKKADVLVEQFRPGAMAAWGLDYEAIKKINPKIVYASITGYGQKGDYANEAGHDFNYLSYSGVMSLIKDDNGKPVLPATQFADIGGSYAAVMAIQSGLINKAHTGNGCYLDISLADAMLPFITIPMSLNWSGMNHRQFNILNGKTTVNYAVYQCADEKWLAVAAFEVKFWNNICELLEKPAWKRKSQMELMVGIFPKKEVVELFLSKNRGEWLEIFKGKDTCVSPILELEDLENSDYHKNKETFTTFIGDGGEELKDLGLPFQSSSFKL